MWLILYFNFGLKHMAILNSFLVRFLLLTLLQSLQSQRKNGHQLRGSQSFWIPCPFTKLAEAADLDQPGQKGGR